MVKWKPKQKWTWYEGFKVYHKTQKLNNKKSTIIKKKGFQQFLSPFAVSLMTSALYNTSLMVISLQNYMFPSLSFEHLSLFSASTGEHLYFLGTVSSTYLAWKAVLLARNPSFCWME